MQVNIGAMKHTIQRDYNQTPQIEIKMDPNG